MEWDNLDIFDDSNDAQCVGFGGRSSVKGFGSSRRSSALFRQDKRPKCGATEVALSESPLLKPKQAVDFEGFSIVKNRVPNSPFSRSDGELIRSGLSRSRGSSICKLYPPSVPQSPHEFHTPMSYPVDPERTMSQIQTLKEELKEKDDLIALLRKDLASANSAKTAAQEDSNAIKFMSSIQEQRIEELELQLSRDRLDKNEELREKSRKHKQIIKKLTQDRSAYEERADQMIKQMNEQMGQLQHMAMARIESLENDLMAQRHSNDKLQAECTRLHACAATAMASATKHRQLAAALKQASPASIKKNLFSPTSTITRTSAAESHFHDHRSSAGSSHASTEIRDDYEEDDDDEDTGLGDANCSSEGDENESGGNTPVASPDPSSKLHKGTAAASSFSPSHSMNSTTSSGSSVGSASIVGAVEKDVWNTAI